MNGTSALLHLVRASLEHWSQDDFKASFCFDPSKMVNYPQYKGNSASRVLSDPDNRSLVIYQGKTEICEEEETRYKGKEKEDSRAEKKKRGYYLFEDLVELRFTALEQIIDHQEHLAGKNGMNLKVRIRKHLEGWDFAEIAKDDSPRPHVATLRALGYGWVDFIRSIGAVTLFGTGFGDIIQPQGVRLLCQNWKQVPAYQYYLAVTTYDLQNIMDTFGDSDTDRPVLNLAWHSPDALAAAWQCQCQEHEQSGRVFELSEGHRSPVQVFAPTRSRLILPLRGPGELYPNGAVIFGHHFAWKYRWRDAGNEGVEEGLPTDSTQPASRLQRGLIRLGLRT